MDNMWYKLFKKEKIMSTKEMHVSKLQGYLEQNKQAIASLQSRLNSMRDEVEALKSDMQKLRDNVVEDIKYLYGRV